MFVAAVTALAFLSGVLLFAQETVGGLQGTIKDSTGAVVAGAHLVLTGTSLVGEKTLDTDTAGYYHFLNLPPGSYKLSITAQGFKKTERASITIEVGHLPTLDITMEVGTTSEVVEVTGAAPLIDTTTETTLTNVTSDVIKDVPHGYSFQSAIQYAPGARNEPLAGGMVGPNAAGGTGTGGQSAGSGTNGQAFGYSIGGGADSENNYLVEGQETADAIGGFSHTNVPFAFIQEMQVKSSGIDAEYGGALGGVVNVVMQKGGNRYHGSVFSQFESGNWDGSPTDFPRYDPTFAGSTTTSFLQDPTFQDYQPKKDTLTDMFPGFTFGGPFIKDKLWFFASFNPEFRDRERVADWNWAGNSAFPAQIGPTPFSSNQQTYYTNARIDYAATQKIRLFGSWLYQYQRESGEFLPAWDATNSAFLNPSSSSPPATFGHNLGYGSPNVTTNVGLDYTITPRLVGTFRWGYNFQNYHDFGMPTGSAFDAFNTSGVGATDNLGNPIPAGSQLSQTAGFFSAANNINNTTYDVTHRNQIDADVSWFKSGWAGTHNFKFGYQLMRLSNAVLQHYNEPNVTVNVGSDIYVPDYAGPVWAANCATADPGGSFDPNSGDTISPGSYGGCGGQYGYLTITDYGSNGAATSVNHAFFVQDAWTIGHGVTINAGVRFEHEYLPAEDQPTGGISKPIQFGWGDKIAPRIGAAWDVLNNGKWKVFGSYGKFFDIMKLNLAISSFGGQYWNNCYYALSTQDLTSVVPTFGSDTRYCGGAGAGASTPANFANGTPAGLTFIQDANFRTFPTTCSTCTETEEGVAPNLKPYEQHETVFGLDHQFAKDVAFEVRWDRRRLDNAIEDAALYSAALASETFVIVNPGKGVNSTYDGFYNFLYGQPSGCQALSQGCAQNPPLAVRDYDGVEFRLTKATSSHWAGMFSYTYSRFWGNYTGLTNTDISDGGGGRNAPNNSRAFDEPFFYYDAAGKLNNGVLPTDRPNVFKGYGYYEIPWMHNKLTTNFGIFQYLYQGSPVSSFIDVGSSFAPDFGAYDTPSPENGAFPTYIVPRGQFIPISQDPGTGNLTIGAPYARRTPWFIQSDLSFQQGYKITESKALTFQVTAPNAFNQRSTTAFWEGIDSDYTYDQFLTPTSPDCATSTNPTGACGLTAGPAFYTAATRGYNYASLMQTMGGTTGTSGVMTLNSLYGKPLYHQLSRNLYMSIKFTF